MNSNISFKEFLGSQKEELTLLLIDYFKEIDPSKIIQSEKDEVLDYPYLDLYWTEKDRKALEIISDKKTVGFVLINSWIVIKNKNAKKSLAEFYIIPEFRRNGLGRSAAFKTFSLFKTKWEVRQSLNNIRAISFWRKVIAEFTENSFSEIEYNSELIQVFESK